MKPSRHFILFFFLYFFFGLRYQLDAQPTHPPLDEATFLNKETYTSLEEASQQNPLQVYKLRLENKGYTAFPMEILKFRNLQQLILHYNQLVELPAEIGLLRNLTRLNIIGNQLVTFPKEIKNLQNLLVLEAPENQLKSLPPEIKELQNLRGIDLEDNQLEIFPIEICALKNLVQLGVTKNKIKVIPREIGQLKNLESFFCSKNLLTELPSELGECKFMRFFHCYENKIKTLPKEIGNWENLTGLRVDNNKLSNFPQGIQNWTKLQYFDCSGNFLKELPKEFFELNNLNELYFVNNQVSIIPDQIEQLTNLKMIDFGENHIQTFPKSITKLQNLEYIGAYTNQLTALPSEIGDLPKLQQFYLQRNQLKSLPKEIAKLINLKEVSFLDNKFVELPKEIFPWLAKNGNSQRKNHLYLISEAIQNNLKKGDIPQAEKLYTDWYAYQTQQKDTYTQAMLLNSGANISLEKKQFSKALNLTQDAQKLLETARKDTTYKISDIRVLESDIKLTLASIEARKSQSQVFWMSMLVAIIVIVSVSTFAWLINRNRQKAVKAKQLIIQQRDDLKEKNQELEAISEELRQQTDTVQAQRDDLETLTEELRQQNEVVEARNLELQSLQSTKDLMISAVNHDLRNPLNPILNYSQADYPKLSEGERLALIHQRAKVMFGLIDDIMDVYRADKLEIHPSPNSLHKAVNEAITVISEAKKDLPLIENQVPESAMALFEYKYIERVLENLLSNAVKYTPKAEEGGKVILKAESMEGKWRISLSDNGQGIPKEKFEEIFLPFSNPDAKSLGAAKSVGIGLTFCKTIVELHHSKIQIESEVGKGTTFYFDLPLVEQNNNKSQNADNQLVTEISLNTEAKEFLQAYLPDLQSFTHKLDDRKLRKLVKSLPDKESIQNWKNALAEAVEQMDEERFGELLAMLL